MQTEYEYHLIQVTDKFLFSVTGPNVNDTFQSLGAAKEKIDTANKAIAAQNREGLSIPLYDEDGNEVTCTGVHGQHYSMLGVSKSGQRVSYVYPHVEWVREMLVEHR